MILKCGGGGSASIGSGGSATINAESNLYISDLVVNAPGFINAYVLTCKDNGSQLTTRDANGFKPFTITDNNITIINYVIPADFDTVLFAKCIGNNTSGDNGDGTVQRYDHSDKTVRVGTKAYPDKPTAKTLDYDRRAAQIINDAAAGTLNLNYLGEVSDSISDGCTHLVDNKSYFHGGVNVSGNAYQKSVYYTPTFEAMGGYPPSNLQTIIEEMMNSTTGIRWDAGGAGSPSIGAGGVIIPEGKRAIRLVNMLPLGFKFSTTGAPAVSTQYLESPEALQGDLPGIERMPGMIPEHPGMSRGDKRINREFPDKRIRDPGEVR